MIHQVKNAPPKFPTRFTSDSEAQSAEQDQTRFRNRKLDFHAFLPRSSCLSEAICGQRIKRGSTISNILERYFVDVG